MTKWIAFSGTPFEVHGLPWFSENAPELWRLPARAKGRVREPVWNLGRFPSGGRIRFSSNTSQLGVRVRVCEPPDRRNMSAFGSQGLDVYVNGAYWSSVCAGKSGEEVMCFFKGAGRETKDMTIYLPLYRETRVEAIGIDEDAEVAPAGPFSRPFPLVFYGSSIAQGAGACRSGMTYEAILGRQLNLDFVDLGFGGNGRAEPEVVDLVKEVEACGYAFDLGKSYGMQSGSAYADMLEAVRSAHPGAPVVCMTPIFSTLEFYDAEYRALSQHTREVMRCAVTARIEAGDRKVYLVEGTDLLGPADADGLHEGKHPTDYGFRTIAARLAPVVEQALAG